MTAVAPVPPYLAPGRDLRLDFFRGLALWFIFLDHVPDNIVSWLTVRNYGFSDATEIFVFISGYTAVIAYSRMMLKEGWPRASIRVYRRVWQLYVAHILLFVAFTAQIAYVSIARDTPDLIEEMQLMGLGQNPYRAILEAALNVGRAADAIEIMIPLVGFASEFTMLKGRIARVADAVRGERGTVPAYLIGTMIELPRAALRAGEIAAEAEFFSFGTNDLTQTTLGVSRDDAGAFLTEYLAKGLIARDPFVTIDRDGVGELVRIAAERGRKTRADIKLGICGEHGGDPDSIRFCHEIGLDYVSCSPFRVPIARLAAAQAALARDQESS